LRGIKIRKHVIQLWLVAVILISTIAGAVGYYVWTNLTVQVEVKEPIEILHYPSSLSLYPGETKEFNVTVHNHASVNYSVVLDFHLENATYQEVYTTFSNEIYAVLAGQQNLTAWIQVRGDAPAINTSLTVNFARDTYPSGLVGYWRLDEGKGDIAFDSSDYANHGLLIYGPTWVNGKYGKALSFDGLDDRVDVPALYAFNPSALTVSAWINSPLTKIGYVFYHGDNGEFVLHNGKRPDEFVSGEGNPTIAGFTVKLSDGLIYTVNSPQMTSNVWHNLVGVWIKGAVLRIYVDGQLAGENTAIPDYALFDPGSGYLPSMGVYNRANFAQNTFFLGTIDQVMIYSRALSPQELLAEYIGITP
jgi:hypothetical protein